MSVSYSQTGSRLDAALERVATTFRGMTARPDEHNCECHWGSADELALLKTPDVELDPDLLRRTWWASDWTDPAAVLRRILPQFAAALVSGQVEPLFRGMEQVGHTFARADWQRWSTEQAAAVQEFLDAWWAHALTDPDPAVPVHELLPLVATASSRLSPWLGTWESTRHPVADRHLAEAVARWAYDLREGDLPWDDWERKRELHDELVAWLVGHAAGRLRAQGAPAELLHRIRQLHGPARWDEAPGDQ